MSRKWVSNVLAQFYLVMGSSLEKSELTITISIR